MVQVLDELRYPGTWMCAEIVMVPAVRNYRRKVIDLKSLCTRFCLSAIEHSLDVIKFISSLFSSLYFSQSLDEPKMATSTALQTHDDAYEEGYWDWWPDAGIDESESVNLCATMLIYHVRLPASRGTALRAAAPICDTYWRESKPKTLTIRSNTANDFRTIVQSSSSIHRSYWLIYIP